MGWREAVRVAIADHRDLTQWCRGRDEDDSGVCEPHRDDLTKPISGKRSSRSSMMTEIRRRPTETDKEGDAPGFIPRAAARWPLQNGLRSKAAGGVDSSAATREPVCVPRGHD
jgi:hypothetical protein